MEEAVKKAFDFAADLTKQLITLATAIIGLTVTLGKDVLQKTPPNSRPWAIASWTAFLFSIACGILTLMALTGTLDQDPKRPPVPVSIRCSSVKTYSGLQAISFLAALILTVVYACLALR
jgi:hypothetical protein